MWAFVWAGSGPVLLGSPQLSLESVRVWDSNDQGVFHVLLACILEAPS